MNEYGVNSFVHLNAPWREPMDAAVAPEQMLAVMEALVFLPGCSEGKYDPHDSWLSDEFCRARRHHRWEVDVLYATFFSSDLVKELGGRRRIEESGLDVVKGTVRKGLLCRLRCAPDDAEAQLELAVAAFRALAG